MGVFSRCFLADSSMFSEPKALILKSLIGFSIDVVMATCPAK